MGPLVLLALLALPATARAAAPPPARRLNLPATSARFGPAILQLDSLVRARRFGQAIEASGPLRAAAHAAGDRWSEMMVDLEVAAAHAMVGHARDAEPAARRGRALAGALGDSLRARIGLRWLAYSLSLQGRSAESDSAYRMLLGESIVAHDERFEGIARTGLAYRALLERNPGVARDGYRRAIQLLRRAGDGPTELVARVGLASALGDLRDFEGARRANLEIVVRADTLGYPNAGADASNNLGTQEYMSGDPAAAVTYWRRSIALFREAGDVATGLIPVSNLALALVELGRTDEALAVFDSALAACRVTGQRDLEAMLLVHHGEVLARMNRLDEAEASFHLGLRLGSREASSNRVDALVGLAHVEQLRGDEAAALARVERDLDPLMPRMGGWNRAVARLLKSRLLEHFGRDREAIATLRLAEQDARETAFLEVAPEPLVLRARVHRKLGEVDSARVALLLAQSIWEGARAVPTDPEWRERRAESGRAIHIDLADLILDRHDAEPARVRAAFDELQRWKSRTLLERMAGPQAFAQARASARAPATLAELQQDVLEDGEVLLDAFVGDSVTFVFAVTRTEARVARLSGADELERRLRLYFGLLSVPPHRNGSTAMLDRTRARIARDVLGPFARELAGARRVLISPDGPLHALPFGELPIAGEAPGAASAPLGEGREVFRVPSGTVLAQLRATGRGRAASGSRVLALEGVSDAKHPTLPGAAREVTWLARNLRGVEVRGEDGPPRALPDSAALAGWDVLHFAAHARVSDQRPWNSGLLLATAPPPEGSLFLEAGRIAGMRLDGALAVLSGCETAGGRYSSGEGVLGLSGAFLSAGTPAVVASLWRVDDAVTVQFMIAFYRQLARGKSVAAALAAAQHQLRADPETAHPFYWAGFVVTGDGAERVPLVERAGFPVGAGFAVILLSALLLAVRPWSRRARA